MNREVAGLKSSIIVLKLKISWRTYQRKGQRRLEFLTEQTLEVAKETLSEKKEKQQNTT